MADEPVADPALATLQAENAKLTADLRRSQLTGLLSDIGAPAAYADVYTGDLDREKLTAFVDGLQRPAATTTQTGQQTEAVSAWGAYEAGRATSAMPPGPDPSPLEALAKKVSDGLDRSLLSRSRRLLPREEFEEQEEILKEIKRANEVWERNVLTGKAPRIPHGAEGFGGPMDPPPYAYVAEDRRLLGIN